MNNVSERPPASSHIGYPCARRTWRGCVELLAVGLVSFLVLLQGFDDLKRVPFHEDESQWIATSCYLEALIDPNFRSPEWLRQSVIFADSSLPPWVQRSLMGEQSSDDPWRPTYWVLTQPPMARYLLGIGRIVGGYSAAQLNVPFHSGRPLEFNRQIGAVPDAGLLRWARLSVVVQSTLSLILLFYLLRRCHSALAGYLCMMSVLSSPFLMLSIRRSMGEGAVLLFSCAGMVAGLRLLDRWKSGGVPLGRQLPSLLWMMFLGVCAGCAGASKLNGLSLAILGVLLGMAMSMRGEGLQTRLQRLLFPIFAGGVVAITAWVSFIAINPFLYSHSVGRLVAMIYLRKREFFDSSGELFATVPELLLAILTNNREVLPKEMVANSYWFSVCFFLIGLGACVRRSLAWLRGQHRDAAGLVILCAALLLAVPSFLGGWRFRRYLLFAAIFGHIAVAVGLAATILCACKFLRARMRNVG